MVDFDIRATLGRKGTSSFDRATALAIVACGEALRDAGIEVSDANRARVGIVLGTTTGSLKSTMDYSRETLVQDRPYLVNPVLFPNTVMNCAAGQAAIWYGLRGLNATVAGGQLGFLHALRYALAALRRGHVDVLLVGAVEEFTPHTAWSAALTGEPTAGEGAAMFAVQRAADADERHADVLAVTTGFSPHLGPQAGPGHTDLSRDEALTRCVRRALDRAGVGPADVWAVATADGHGDRAQADAAIAAIGGEPEILTVRTTLGDSPALSGALGLGAVLARCRQEPALAGRYAVITGRSRDGGVAAAVVRGWGDVGVDRG
jgi:3-oxoacyl-[acyl-carrier-protein] synthase II